MPRKTVKQIAEEHWHWVEMLLAQQRLMEKRLYIDAFIHGYKHAKEDK